MFKTKIKIKFSDCDAGGRMFYAKLFEYAHEVYEEFVLDELKHFNIFTSEEYLVPIAKATANFYKPIILHEEIDIQLIVNAIGEHSFSLKYVFLNDKVKLADVETLHVFVDKKIGKKLKIDETLKSVLSGFAG